MISKPKLSVKEQVEHLESRGVKFDIYERDAALAYLSNNNNYFKLTAYRKNFPKHPAGVNKGKYIDLDFAYLVDLSVIDMRLRYIIIQLCLDIEHYAKVKLLKYIEENDKEDGYAIVRGYKEHLDPDALNKLHSEIEHNKKSVYCRDVIEKYNNDFPAWAFVEVITFGTFIHFYKFCAEKFDERELKDDHYLMLRIKNIRNASAHNNCIINDLTKRNDEYTPSFEVKRGLGELGVTKETHTRQFQNERIQQVITLIYVHKRMVSSQDVRNHRAEILREFSGRMMRNCDYYLKNDTITSAFTLFKIVIDNWCKLMV